MKNESSLSSDLMARCRQDLRGSVVVKHSDKSTHAVPDITATWMGYTNWIEDKYQRKGKKLRDILKTKQLILGHELATASNGHSFTVIYEQEPKRVTIWQPRVLMAQMFPKVILLDSAVVQPVDIVMTSDGGTAVNLATALSTCGAIRSDGWNHQLVTKLIKHLSQSHG